MLKEFCTSFADYRVPRLTTDRASNHRREYWARQISLNPLMGRTGSMGIGVGPWSPTSRQMVSEASCRISWHSFDVSVHELNGAATVRRESRDGLLDSVNRL